jgi:hypothetical protein
MWRVETGQTSLRSHDVETMCRVYGAPEELKVALMGLAKETKGKGWWHASGDVIPESFDLFIGLEEAARSLESYSTELIPGLFQTSDYARDQEQRPAPRGRQGDDRTMNADFAGATWRKSSRSNSEQECVEVAQSPTAIGIRDGKNPEGGHLALDLPTSTRLLTHAKAGTLDL